MRADQRTWKHVFVNVPALAAMPICTMRWHVRLGKPAKAKAIALPLAVAAAPRITELCDAVRRAIARAGLAGSCRVDACRSR